jgi:choline dehydrogenase-like flavoprotein
MKRIVIIGAGFAGLAAAKALRYANADVLVIDRANHNLFQPLLYQVATTVLSPAQIASPIRGLLKNQRNTTVFLGEVSGINKDAKFVYADSAWSDCGEVPLLALTDRTTRTAIGPYCIDLAGPSRPLPRSQPSEAYSQRPAASTESREQIDGRNRFLSNYKQPKGDDYHHQFSDRSSTANFNHHLEHRSNPLRRGVQSQAHDDR